MSVTRPSSHHGYVAYLHVDDADAFLPAADAASCVRKPPADEPWGMREMAVRSPDGHRFMLGAPVAAGEGELPPRP